jgi:hypothetical protein
MIQKDFILELEAKRLLQEKTKLSPEDFYWENGKMIFTREYHIKRGRCCYNNCLNCPFADLSEGDEYRERNFDIED